MWKWPEKEKKGRNVDKGSVLSSWAVTSQRLSLASWPWPVTLFKLLYFHYWPEWGLEQSLTAEGKILPVQLSKTFALSFQKTVDGNCKTRNDFLYPSLYSRTGCKTGFVGGSQAAFLPCLCIGRPSPSALLPSCQGPSLLCGFWWHPLARSEEKLQVMHLIFYLSSKLIPDIRCCLFVPANTKLNIHN